MASLQISRFDALSCIPVRNPIVLETWLDTGEILLTYPDIRRPWFMKFFQKISNSSDNMRMRKLQLDTLGTDVWNLVDGKSTVINIIDAFAARHRLYHKEAEVSVAQFLRELGRRGIIGMKQISG